MKRSMGCGGVLYPSCGASRRGPWRGSTSGPPLQTKCISWLQPAHLQRLHMKSFVQIKSQFARTRCMKLHRKYSQRADLSGQCSFFIYIQIKNHQIPLSASISSPCWSYHCKALKQHEKKIKNTSHQEESSGQSPNCLRPALNLTNYTYILSGRKTTTKICSDAFFSLTTHDVYQLTGNNGKAETVQDNLQKNGCTDRPDVRERTHKMFSLSEAQLWVLSFTNSLWHNV